MYTFDIGAETALVIIAHHEQHLALALKVFVHQVVKFGVKVVSEGVGLVTQALKCGELLDRTGF